MKRKRQKKLEKKIRVRRVRKQIKLHVRLRLGKCVDRFLFAFKFYSCSLHFTPQLLLLYIILYLSAIILLGIHSYFGDGISHSTNNVKCLWVCVYVP